MKIKIILGVIGALLLTLALLIGYSGFKISTRHSAIQGNSETLAVYIETFRENNGRYPDSIGELSDKIEKESKVHLTKILNDQWNDRYEYKMDTDGFSITAIMPSGFLVKDEKYERRYKIGEALKAYDVPPKEGTHR